MESALNNISISKLKDMGFDGVVSDADDIILTDSIDHLDVFRDPCRVDGIVLFICLEGKVVCDINLKRHVLEPGDMIVSMNSNIIQVQNASCFKAMAILVTMDYLNRLRFDINSRLSIFMNVIKSQATVSLPPSEIEGFSMIFRLIIKAIVDNRPDCQDFISVMLQALCSYVVSAVQTFAPQSCGERKPQRTELIFEQFMQLLTKHHVKERNVGFYADLMGLSPNYLSQSVKTYSERSAAEWINEYTITEAKVLLRFSELSVQQVAEKLNFSSQSAFGKYFKQYVGTSPKTFRRESREG